MKLSDVKGERVFDVIADIIEPVIDIASSAETKEMLYPKPCPEGEDPHEYMLKRIRKFAPTVIRSNKQNAIAVLSAIAGKTPKQYTKDMTLTSLLADVSELLQDEVFTDFLASLNSGTE